MKKSLIIHPHEISKKWIDKMADAGVQTIGIHPVGGAEAHENLEKLLNDLETSEFRKLIDYASDRGLEIAYEFHAASYLLPRELFSEHPEYFRIDSQGNRTPELNFCASNPDALDIAAKRARELATKLYHSCHTFYFWLDDARDMGCRCERCKKLSDSDQQQIILNAMLKEIRKEYSDAKLSYLAYFNTLTPPKTVLPEEGIFVEYAPIDRDFTKRVGDCKEEDIANIRSLLEFFGKKDAKVLEYWLDNSLFSQWKPDNIQKLSPNNEIIRDDIAFYRSLGFDNISTFACYLGEAYEKLYGEADISGFTDDL